MFKRDKYHNCFKITDTNARENKNKRHKKSAQERWILVEEMLSHFGWSKNNIELLKEDWFDLEEEQ